MKRILAIISLFFGVCMSAQVQLAYCPTYESASLKTGATITLLLMNYRGEQWYRENIFEPFYIQKKSHGKCIFRILFDGSIKLKFGGALPEDVKKAYESVAKTLERDHYTLYSQMLIESDPRHTIIDSIDYVNRIKWIYSERRKATSSRSETPVFMIIPNLNPIALLNCLDYNVYLSQIDRSNQAKISYFEYVKSAAIYYYVKWERSSLTYNLSVPDIIAEVERDGETDEDEVMGTTDSTAIETLLIRDYADSYIYSDSVMERIITPAGDYTPTDGYRYFIRDYQGNVMAVVKGAELKQWNYYYPDGTPFTTSTAGNRFMFSGKELDSMNALYWYDFHARYYDPLIGITPTQDRHAEKYYPYSPYSYCFGNPVKYIDPTGMDVAIIISPKSVKRFGHIALLVQNENKEWRYYSVNGDDKYIIGSHSGAKTTDDIDVPVAGDPQLFLDSDGGGKEYDYEKAFVIPTTSEQDQIIAETFEKESEKDYNLIGSNCATAVANSLKSAGVSIEVPQIVAPPGFNRIINKTLGNSIIPKGLYNEITQMQKSIGYEIVKE